MSTTIKKHVNRPGTSGSRTRMRAGLTENLLGSFGQSEADGMVAGRKIPRWHSATERSNISPDKWLFITGVLVRCSSGGPAWNIMTNYHRYCWYRESDRKFDPSRSTGCVFGPFLPLLCSFSILNHINFRRRNPHGFKTLCRRVALCGN
jgi:hypothetical protein